MKNVLNLCGVYIKTLRFPVCFLALLLTSTSFIMLRDGRFLQYVPIFFAVWLVTDVTMRQNDWRDRVNDLKKGRSYVHQYEKDFLIILILLWIVTVLLIGFITHFVPFDGILLALMALVGALYSETRRIPMAPLILVSLTAVSPVLLAYPFAGWSDTHAQLFLMGACLIFAREIMGDIFDVSSDYGYKWTIPQKLGVQKAKYITTGFFVMAAYLTLVSFGVTMLLWEMIASFGCYRILWNGDTNGYKYLDGGLLLILLTIILKYLF